MSDDNTEPVEDAPEATPTTETDEEPFDEKRAREKIAKANSEAANLRRRLKELEPLASKYRELEEAGKTEVQKLTERLTAAEKRAADAEIRALRLEIGAKYGLTPAQAKRLIGSTAEELEADAKELLESFKPAVEPSGRTHTPREALQYGGESRRGPKPPAEQFAELVSQALNR